MCKQSGCAPALAPGHTDDVGASVTACQRKSALTAEAGAALASAARP